MAGGTIGLQPARQKANDIPLALLSDGPGFLEAEISWPVIHGWPMNGRQGYFSFKEAGTIG